jgi:alpha-glucosidase
VAEVATAPHDPVTRYAFRFVFDDGQVWLTAGGQHPGEPDPRTTSATSPATSPPRGSGTQVVYQVFPDRFRNGDPAGNGPVDGAWTLGGQPIVRRAWHERPTRGMGAREFFGGDLDGVREGLDHLADLGAGTLYLNPIFVSPSSHKYDTVDYERVDPHLGGDAGLRAAAPRGAARRGMRVVLDAVVNHTSDRHPWFDRDGRADPPGAYADPASPHRDRYVFLDPADPTATSAGPASRSLPCSTSRRRRCATKVYAGDDAVLRRWLRPPWSIDGWRLDVIHMLGEGAGAGRNADHVRAIRARHPRGAARRLRARRALLRRHRRGCRATRRTAP